MICRAPLENDVLVLDTGAMQREFAWNRGNPITRKIVDHARGRSWSFVGTDADAAIPGSKEAGALLVPRDLQVTRLDSPIFPGRHQRVEVIRFFDITDRNNNLVRSHNVLPYRAQTRLVGSVLFIDPLLESGGLFVLKEAPNASGHVAYPGFDFLAQENTVQTVGIGVRADDVTEGEWTRAYGAVTGVTGWTGFQSVGEESGYLVVYREWCDRESERIDLYGLRRRRLAFELVCGQGKTF